MRRRTKDYFRNRRPNADRPVSQLEIKLPNFKKIGREICTKNLVPGTNQRFDTVLKSNRMVNISLAEKLMGHSKTIPLDNSYFKPVIEQLFDEYQKAIPQLIIDDKYRLEEKLKQKDNQINELESKDQEIDMLKMTILEIKNNMLELQNKIKS